MSNLAEIQTDRQKSSNIKPVSGFQKGEKTKSEIVNIMSSQH